jgi:predicted transcriptional regulator
MTKLPKYDSYLQVKTDDDTKNKLRHLCQITERDMSKMVRWLIQKEWDRVTTNGEKESCS